MPATCEDYPLLTLREILRRGYVPAVEAAEILRKDRSIINYLLKTGQLTDPVRDRYGRLYVREREIKGLRKPAAASSATSGASTAD